MKKKYLSRNLKKDIGEVIEDLDLILIGKQHRDIYEIFKWSKRNNFRKL